MVWFAKYLAPHLRKPSTGLWGYIVKRLLIRLNTQLEHATFEKLQAKDSDNVLELGFGYGSGISYALDKSLRSGSGKMFGVDYSATACNAVKTSLRRDIENQKLHIFHADVAQIPLDDDTIDKVFHTNCYYFWPDKKAAAIEVKRVMKAGGLMVTGVNTKRVEMAAGKGFLKDYEWRPEVYIDALHEAGFSDVRKETSFIEAYGTEIMFIHAVKP